MVGLDSVVIENLKTITIFTQRSVRETKIGTLRLRISVTLSVSLGNCYIRYKTTKRQVLDQRTIE